MRKNFPTISIIMPTLNSENTIEKSLSSIIRQDYPTNLLEILVVDGGSKDKTIAIAKKYGAKVVPNPNIQPECAKLEGLKIAKSKYALFLDSDEVLGKKDSISKKISIMENNKINFLSFGGYKKPDNFSFINDYINIFSEPFSNFMYGVATDFRYFIGSLKEKFDVCQEGPDYVCFRYTSDNLPLFDMCASNCLNLEYLKEIKNEIILSDIPKLFYEISKNDKRFFVIKNDFIYHYSSDTLSKFLKKIKWRILSNLFFKDKTGAGYLNRENYSKKKYKKYLFVLYGYSLVLPLIESIYKSFKYKNFYLMIHFPLTIYTVYLITYFYTRYLLKIPPKLTIYG